MVWFADNFGRYTVRSGYRCLVGSRVEDAMNTDSSGVYKNIWELNLPPKIRIAVWRFTKDYIPATVNLYNRRFSSSPSCPSYGEASENFMHTLLVCGPSSTWFFKTEGMILVKLLQPQPGHSGKPEINAQWRESDNQPKISALLLSVL